MRNPENVIISQDGKRILNPETIYIPGFMTKNGTDVGTCPQSTIENSFLDPTTHHTHLPITKGKLDRMQANIPDFIQPSNSNSSTVSIEPLKEWKSFCETYSRKIKLETEFYAWLVFIKARQTILNHIPVKTKNRK